MPRARVRPLATLCFTLWASLSSGCTTILQPIGGNTPAAFGGTRLALDMCRWAEDPVVACLVINAPFALVADTLLLPLTVPMELLHEGETRLFIGR